MTKYPLKPKEFSKEEVKFVIQNWEKMSNHELAEAIERPAGSISYLAHKIRAAGYNMPKRTKQSLYTLRVQEALKELKLI